MYVGDLFPVTSGGRTLACITAIGGIICIALPVTVIGTNFTKEYDAYFERQKQYKLMKDKMIVKHMKSKLKRLPSIIGLQGIAMRNRRHSRAGEQLEQVSVSAMTSTQRADMKKAFDVFDNDKSGILYY